MTPLHGIACFYDDGFGARAVSCKTPIYFIMMITMIMIMAIIMMIIMIMIMTIIMMIIMGDHGDTQNDHDDHGGQNIYENRDYFDHHTKMTLTVK